MPLIQQRDVPDVANRTGIGDPPSGEETWPRQRARLLSILGRHDEAVALARRSVLLDPLAPGAHRYLGLILYHARQYDSSLAAYRRSLALSPDNVYTLAYQSYSLTAVGLHDESVRTTERAVTLAPDDQVVLSAAGAANAAASDTVRARALAQRLGAQSQPSAYLQAEIAVHLDEGDRVFRLLERAAAERDPFLPEMHVTPTFDRLKDDPRMGRLLRRIGLQEE